MSAEIANAPLGPASSAVAVRSRAPGRPTHCRSSCRDPLPSCTGPNLSVIGGGVPRMLSSTGGGLMATCPHSPAPPRLLRNQLGSWWVVRGRGGSSATHPKGTGRRGGCCRCGLGGRCVLPPMQLVDRVAWRAQWGTWVTSESPKVDFSPPTISTREATCTPSPG